MRIALFCLYVIYTSSVYTVNLQWEYKQSNPVTLMRTNEIIEQSAVSNNAMSNDCTAHFTIWSHHQQQRDSNLISQYTEHNIDTLYMTLFDNTILFDFDGFLKYDSLQLVTNRSNQLEIPYRLQLAEPPIFLLVYYLSDEQYRFLNNLKTKCDGQYIWCSGYMDKDSKLVYCLKTNIYFNMMQQEIRHSLISLQMCKKYFIDEYNHKISHLTQKHFCLCHCFLAFILLLIILSRNIQTSKNNTATFIAIIISNIAISTAQPIVESFGIGVANTMFEFGPTSDITVTLWFSNSIYECILYPLSEGSSYQCDSSTWTVISNTNPCAEYKMMIDNSDTDDEILIDRMFVNMDDNTFYGINGWCLYDYPDPDNWFYVAYAYYYQYDYGCTSHEETPILCIDNENECAPGKQIAHFDVTKPNQNIVNSVWESGINIIVAPCTLAPTNSPTAAIPTFPTFPTLAPTTAIPTLPTLAPTNMPTAIPTLPTCPLIISHCVEENKCITCHSSCEYCQCYGCGYDHCELSDCMTCRNSSYTKRTIWDDNTGFCISTIPYPNNYSPKRHEYIAVSKPLLNWVNANQYCQDNFGTQLATIESEEDKTVFMETINSLEISAQSYWIGLNDRNSESVFQFVDGTPCNEYCMTLWSYGEPNNGENQFVLSAENCVNAPIGDNMFNDEVCNNNHGFVCNYQSIFKGNISCNATLSGNVNTTGYVTGETHYYHLILNNSTSVIFDTCNSYVDVSVAVYDESNNDLADQVCKQYFSGEAENDWCGQCSNWNLTELGMLPDGYTYPENFMISDMEPQKTYTISVKSNSNNIINSAGEYELNIRCTNISATTVCPFGYRLDVLYDDGTGKCIRDFKYLYHDPMSKISSNWEVNGNVSIVNSPQCPSVTAEYNNNNITFSQGNICISNSYNLSLNGQYEWKSFNPDKNVAIYANNTQHIFVYMPSNTNKYYLYHLYQINDYETDKITLAKCEVNSPNIFDCNGKWQVLSEDTDTWRNDIKIISIPCNNVCISGNDNPALDGTYRYRRLANIINNVYANVYYCEECDAYLQGEPGGIHGIWTEGDDVTRYYWSITKLINLHEGIPTGISRCAVHCEEDCLSGVLNVHDCSHGDLWRTFTIEDSWGVDADMIVKDCKTTSFESRICVDGAMNSLINGEYKWLYRNFFLKGSTYFNAKSNQYIYPYINSEGEYMYIITYEETILELASNINAKCNLGNQTDTDISHCFEKWQFYDNNSDSWKPDPNLMAIRCQDVCMHKSEYNTLLNGASFRYFYFNQQPQFPNTIIYKCVQCSDEAPQYLFGWIDASNRAWWVITAGLEGESDLYLAKMCDVGIQLANNYVFNIDDCSAAGSWGAYAPNGTWYVDKGLYITKCNAETAQETCVKLPSKSEIQRTYSLPSNIRGLALGMDVSFISLDRSDRLKMQYACNGNTTNIQYYNLTIFDYQFEIDTATKNIVYTLPLSCDNASSISLRLVVDGAGDMSDIYIDNVYLYQDVNNKVFFDDMQNNLHWSEESASATAGYDLIPFCSQDSCYKMNVINNYVEIVSHVVTTNGVYNYKDFNLQWLLKTDLSNDSFFNVEIQCDNNYLYVNDLCILKQYNRNDKCIDDSCTVQSYNLPVECDFSSEISIKFYLESSVSTDIVYIDNVLLSHSDLSGQISPLCRTLSPTIDPTLSPTIDPTLSPIIETFSSVDYILSSVDYILMAVGALLLLLFIAALIYCIIKSKSKYKAIIIKNAMVIILSIGDYDDDAVNPDPTISIGSLTDLEVEQDVKNLCEIFGHEHLNYTIAPDYSSLDYTKVSWTQEEIINLLTKKAEELHDDRQNEQKYDALIVVISSHGISNKICTTDYQLIEQPAIHRIFSAKYPESRTIPRLFLFDCCSGLFELERPMSLSEQTRTIEVINDTSKAVSKQTTSTAVETYEIKKQEKGKNFGLGNIETDLEEEKKNIWTTGQLNPDHQLVVINAANTGFQSKLDTTTGSYMLTGFVMRLLDDKFGKKYLFEIFDDIQEELAVEKKKQQIVTTYNDRTRFIMFHKHEIDNDIDNEVEHEEVNVQMDV